MKDRERARWLGDLWRYHTFWKGRIELEFEKDDE